MEKFITFHMATASWTDQGSGEHLEIVLAFSSLAADPLEAIRVVRQWDSIPTFSKGPFVVAPAAPALA